MNKEEFFPFYTWLLPTLNAKEALFMSLFLNKYYELNKSLLMNKWSSCKNADEMFWFTITADEIHLQTGLSRTQQVAIKKRLYELGYLETERRGTPPKNWYKINASKVNILINLSLPNE